MRNPLAFFGELMGQPVWIPVWVLYLMVINLASVGFWAQPLARLIFIAFMASAVLMMGLYARFGFEKILALGHVLWVPLLLYVLARMPAAQGGFRTYLIVLSISLGISLVFDFRDAWRYFAYRRKV